MDVRANFPFADDSFDLILATMVFNEITSGGLKRALNQCYRVLTPDGRLLITVTHPDFIDSLLRREQIRKNKIGIFTMPASQEMRLPIVPRKTKDYEKLLNDLGFNWETTDVYPTQKVLNEKTGLRNLGSKPVGLVLTCRKQVQTQEQPNTTST